MDIGLVFKADDKIYVTEYSDRQFSDGSLIDDDENIYDKLREDQLAFVEIDKYHMGDGDIAFSLRDHGFYTLGNELKDDIKGYEVLLELDCRDKLCEFIEELKDEIENKE